jgi:uncharacterized protein (DUF1015 family)
MVGEQRGAAAKQLVSLGLDRDPLPQSPGCAAAVPGGAVATIRAGLLQLQGHDDQLVGGSSMVAADPFRGLRFDPAVVGDLGTVIAPPYDVITPEARDAYEAMNPYNVVRLILARERRDDSCRYEQAAKLLTSWRDEGALVLDSTPSLYLYEETYTVRGERRVQRGVLASVTLDDTGEVILPHEGTMVAPVEDRLRLLEATRANLSPIFGVYAGGGRAVGAMDAVAATVPAIDTTDGSGLGHRLWTVTDNATIERWRALIARQRVLIADGHHRYRTALAYRDAMRRSVGDGSREAADRSGGVDGASGRSDPAAGRAASGGVAPWEQTLMFLVDIDLEGPSVLPVHRVLAGVDAEAVLSRLERDFEAVPVATPTDLESRLEREPGSTVAFGLYGGGRTWLLIARDPSALRARTGLDDPLDVDVLHEVVLTALLDLRDPEHQVRYSGNLAESCRQVDQGIYSSVLAMRSAPFADVVRIAQRGRILPPKTTFFYPKPRDGLVLRPLDPATFAAPSTR